MAVFLSLFAGAGQQFFTNAGVPLAGGKIYTYGAGGSTPLATYTTSAGNIAHPNPIVLDSSGRVPGGGEVWLTSDLAYKFVLQTSASVTIQTLDNVAGGVDGASLAASSGSSLVGFITANAGAVARTVQSKLRDTVSVEDFGAVADGIANDTTAWNNWLAATGSKYIPRGYYLVSGVVKYYNTGTFVNTTDTNHSAGLYALEKITSGNANTAFGNLAGSSITTGDQNTAVGKSALQTMQAGSNNTAIGFGSLRYANDASCIQNTIVGAFCGEQITSGNNNTAVGHNTLRTLTTGDLNTAVGQGALANTVTGDYNTAVGYHALLNQLGSNGVAYGVEALTAMTTGANNTAVGYRTLKSVVTSNSNTALGHQAGQSVTSAQNTIVGDSAMNATTTGAANTAIGYNALLSNQTGEHNTVLGAQALISCISGSRNVSIGRTSLLNATGDENVAVGTNALNACTSGYVNTAIGHGALIALTTELNCTGLGAGTAVTGSNQVQLGNSSTTTYAYGAVQNRSDMRDKADVRDTVLGLDFINSLRPVDFKWDLREDYEYGNKDGSKKRNRFHHGLIAQEVKSACDSAGVDFGGYQDHSVKGGKDVLSLGYEELIAPLIKAVQQLSAEVIALKSNKG